MSKIMYGGIAYGSAVNKDYGWTDLTGTLVAGETTLTIQHEIITPNVTIEPYSDPFGVSPKDMVITNGQVVLTFKAQLNDVRIMVRVSKTNIGDVSIPLDLTNEVHNIQNNRTITISRNTIVSSISSWTDCIGIIAIPLDLSDGSNIIIAKYDLQGYSKTDTVYYSTMFFDNNNTVSNVVQKTGAYTYGYKQLYQADIAADGSDDINHIECLGVPPNISETPYLKINFGTSNYKSLSLFKAKV